MDIKVISLTSKLAAPSVSHIRAQSSRFVHPYAPSSPRITLHLPPYIQHSGSRDLFLREHATTDCEKEKEDWDLLKSMLLTRGKMAAGLRQPNILPCIPLGSTHKHLPIIGQEEPCLRPKTNFALTRKKLISQSGFTSQAKCFQKQLSQTLEIKRFTLSGYWKATCLTWEEKLCQRTTVKSLIEAEPKEDRGKCTAGKNPLPAKFWRRCMWGQLLPVAACPGHSSSAILCILCKSELG